MARYIPLSLTKVRGIACKRNALAKPGKISLNKHIAIGANMCQNNSYMFVSRNFDWFGQRISFTGVPIFFTNWLQKIYPTLIALSCSLEQSKCIKLYTIVFVISQGFHWYPISIGFHVKRSGQDQSKSVFLRNSTFPRFHLNVHGFKQSEIAMLVQQAKGVNQTCLEG